MYCVAGIIFRHKKGTVAAVVVAVVIVGAAPVVIAVVAGAALTAVRRHCLCIVATATITSHPLCIPFSNLFMGRITTLEVR